MAKNKTTLTLEQISEGAKNLPLKDLIAHYKNTGIILDALIAEKEETVSSEQQNIAELKNAKGK